MILFSSKKSAVHDMHLTAIAEYAGGCGLEVTLDLREFSAMAPLLRSADKVVFSQATGISSMLVLPLARLLGKRVVHYMHEPTPLRRKLKENPWIKSILWHAVQWVEMRVASRVMVSRPELLEQAVAVYGIAPEKIVLAPLLMPQVSLPQNTKKTRVTYLGRIDERRYFQEFIDIAPSLRRRGFLPTILTGDTGTFEKYRSTVPSEIEIFAERNFSEELKTQVLSESLCLWNPKRGEIAQSGVTADAVRYGTAILLTNKDPSFDLLCKAGVAVDFYEAQVNSFTVFDDMCTKMIENSASEIFSEQHGALAFQHNYLQELK